MSRPVASQTAFEYGARLGSVGDQRGHLPQRSLLVYKPLQFLMRFSVGDRRGDQLSETGEPGFGASRLGGGGQCHHRAPGPVADGDRHGHRRAYAHLGSEHRGDRPGDVRVVDPGRAAGMVELPGRTVFVQLPRGTDRKGGLQAPSADVQRHTAGFEAGDADQRQVKAARHLPGDDGEDFLLGGACGDQRRDAPERGLLICDHLQALARGPQVLLGTLALGDVADVSDEGWLAGQVGPGHGQLGGEFVSVSTHGGSLDPAIEDVRLPGRQEPGQPAPVRLPRRWRHERFGQLPAEDLIGAVAEDALGGGVDVRHDALLVDDDHAIECCRENGAVAGFAGAEFSGPGLGDLTLASCLLGGPARGQIGEADGDAVSAWYFVGHRGAGDRDHGPVLADEPVLLEADQVPGFPAAGKRALLDREA